MRNPNFTLINGVSSGASATSSAIDASQIYGISAQAVFTDITSTGTVKFQGSNDPCAYGNVAADFTPTNWSDVLNGSVAVTAGGVVSIQVDPVRYRWLRVVFTRTAGAGTITVNVNAQGF
jgi:hypothetical protein